MIKSLTKPDLHIVKEQWTSYGIYTGTVRKIGKSKDFTLEGEGTMVLKHPNGKVVKFVGEFMNDKKDGYGVLTNEQPSSSGSMELLD